MDTFKTTWGYHFAHVAQVILDVSSKAAGPERPHASEPVDIWETRKVNLRALIAERAGGSVVRFAGMVGHEGHSYFSRIIGARASRNLGPTVARRIENAFKLERGWMDKDHGPGAAAVGQSQGLSPRALELAKRFDTLPQKAQDHVTRMVDSIAGLVSDRSRAPRVRVARKRP